MGSQLQSIILFEKGKGDHADILTSWIYPSLDQDLEYIIRKRISWNTYNGRAYVWSRYKNAWHYILTASARDATPYIEVGQSFAVVLASSTFNPEKYLALLHVLADRYGSSGDPIQLLEVYLAVFTTGQYQGVNDGSFNNTNYKDTLALLESSSIKELINRFGVESVLIWNAMIQKKRIVILDDSLPRLFQLIRTLPQLVWHRQNWNLLRPLVTLSEKEVADLQSARIYIAGFLDPSIRSRHDLWDVLIDGTDDSVIVAEHSAKDDLKMGSLHKSVAALLLDAAGEEKNFSDQDIIKALALKTRDIITELRAQFGEVASSAKELIDLVETSHVPPNMKRFVIRVALAEGLLVILHQHQPTEVK